MNSPAKSNTTGNAATEPSRIVSPPAVRKFAELSRADISWAGGKGANLGELTRAGMPVPPGFVVGAPAYAEFCSHGLREQIANLLAGIDHNNPKALEDAALRVKQLVLAEPFPDRLGHEVREAMSSLGGSPVAVRSSATAEDTAEASFAGMNESYLNVRGADETIEAIRRCWGSLFGARTIFYRIDKGLPATDLDIAVVVQRQIDSTKAGVMFTADPATGDRNKIVVEASLGLGEAVVAGSVSPDHFIVDKRTGMIADRFIRPKRLVIDVRAGESGTTTRTTSADEEQAQAITDAEVLQLARLGEQVESHYGFPQDTEWAIDKTGKTWLLQARPITTGVHVDVAQSSLAPPAADSSESVLVHGLGASGGVVSGTVRVVESRQDAAALKSGEILVTRMTAPDWVPLMRRAGAIVTDSGGVTCHAAIVARELGLPCIVGTQDATTTLMDGTLVTVDAAHGVVYAGHRPVPRSENEPAPPVGSLKSRSAAVTDPAITTAIATKLLVNLSEPSQAEAAAALPVDGVGLVRAELMILETLEGVHPRVLIERGESEKFIDRMADSLLQFAAAFAPRPVTYRTIDFRSNEFRGLEGGERFEPVEANPMIGYRGAFRYTREPDLFRLELDAVAKVFEAGYSNLHVMLPFVRTSAELLICRELITATGLLDQRGFELWVMAEVPSVIFNLESYARLGIAGISIGSNDLTQLLLGADRDSELLATAFDARDPAVLEYIAQLISKARRLELKTSICGQAPSIYPEYAEHLVRAGIDAISVSTDTVERVRRLIVAAEQRVALDATSRTEDS